MEPANSHPTIMAEIRGGQILPLDPTPLPEGARVLVTLLSNEDDQFWQTAGRESLAATWDNDEDDVYAQLLKK